MCSGETSRPFTMTPGIRDVCQSQRALWAILGILDAQPGSLNIVVGDDLAMDANSLTHIRPGARWRSLGLADVWEYRNLLLSLGLRDVKLRYKQTLLGVAWVVLQPVLSAGILTAVFGFIAAVPSPSGVPYFVFAYMGQVAWTLFSLTLTRTSGSMVGSAALVMKIYFPRPILPLATILSVLLDFAICLALAVPMVILYGRNGVNIQFSRRVARADPLCDRHRLRVRRAQRAFQGCAVPAAHHRAARALCQPGRLRPRRRAGQPRPGTQSDTSISTC